ncbi:MAG: DUF4412 domain-containing protein [bacterium]
MVSVQKGVVVTQKMMLLESDAVHKLLAGKGIEKTDDMANYLFDLPYEEFIKQHKIENSDEAIREIVMYLQDGKFRMDMQAPMGKMSNIIREDLDKMYNIMWAQKKYMEMSLSQIRQMRKGVMQNMPQMQNMPDMSKMLEHPPPEAREKALEAMRKAGRMQQMQGQKIQDEPQSAEKTGRKKTINDFPCEEWLVRKGDSISRHWVTSSKAELARMIKDFSGTLRQGLGMNKKNEETEKEIWELVPGTIPIETRKFKQDRMGKVELEITRVEKIEQKQLAGKTFEVPEGFEPGSMFDMMNMQPGKKEWD